MNLTTNTIRMKTLKYLTMIVLIIGLVSCDQGNGNKTDVRILRRPGTGIFPNDVEIRILVTEADVFKSMSNQVDLNDYNNVNRYLGLGN